MLKSFQESNRAAFIPFLVVGDPSIEATERAVDILVEEGADLLELGVPFSDALADGPVIQAASERASRSCGSIVGVLELAGRIRRKHPGLPLILFTYFNPILRLGIETFARAAQLAGVEAALVVDLPPEEAGFYRKIMENYGIKTVFLASPTTSSDRFPNIADASTGFIYYVSRTGVTGVQQSLSESLESELAALRKLTRKPVAVGFGISNAEQAKVVARLGDAVVVGSAFVKLMAQHAQDPARMETEVRKLARELVVAIRTARS